MRPARPGLRVARPANRRAHLLADRLRDVLETLVVDFEDAPASSASRSSLVVSEKAGNAALAAATARSTSAFAPTEICV